MGPGRETLMRVVAEWLEEERLPSVVPRDVPPVVGARPLSRIAAVVGPRRAGKTCFMFQCMASLLDNGVCSRDDILFLDFEDFRLAGMGGRELDEVFVVFQQLTGKYPRYLFFDEIQNLKMWSRVLRTLHNRRKFSIVVTGSNSRLSSREVATELRGRCSDVMILPFPFREYVRVRGLSFSGVALHTAARGRLLAAFDDYLAHGGFPEVVMAEGAHERRRLLRDYFRTIFYRDVVERYAIRAPYVMEALMSELLESYSAVFSVSAFERASRRNGLPVSKRTVANYFHHLQESFFVVAVRKFSFSPRKRAMNPRKVYLIDTGFASIGGAFTENRGRILENAVAVELLRRGVEFYYFKGRRECDFMVKRGVSAACAVQVCWEITDSNRKREVGGLLEACRAAGISSGVILTYDQEGAFEEEGMEIRMVPVWKWMLGLGGIDEFV